MQEDEQVLAGARGLWASTYVPTADLDNSKLIRSGGGAVPVSSIFSLAGLQVR